MTDSFGLQKHYIDGAYVPSGSGAKFDVLNPATNGVLATVACGGADDVELAVGAARRAFDEGPWPRMKATERAAVLRRIAEAIRDNADELIDARGRRHRHADRADERAGRARSAQNFDYYAGVVTELHGRSFQVGDEFLNYTIRKPVGVAGLIMPWNAPLMLSTWRIAPALAAGNTVVLKPAEWSPLTLDAARRSARGGGAARRRVQRRPRLRRDGGRRALAPSGRRPHLLHGGDDDRPDDHRRRRTDAEALLGRARRQVAGRGLRGRRRRAVRRRRARPDLHDERPALHGGLAPACPAPALRAARRRDRRARGQRARRRSVRPGHGARPADPRRAPRARHGLHRVGARRRSPGARGRRPAGGLRGGELPLGDGHRRRRPRT